MKKVSESGRGFRVQGWRASGRRRLTCSKDFSPASLPTALMSSSTALLACCRKKTKTDSHQKTSSSRHKSGSFSWWRMTHWVLAELLVGSSDPSLFSPADKHLGVRHHYSDEVGLRRRETQLPEEALNPTRPDPTWSPGLLPVSCRRAQTPAARGHSGCTRSRSSPERCTRLATA